MEYLDLREVDILFPEKTKEAILQMEVICLRLICHKIHRMKKKNENTENLDAIFSTNNKAETGDALEVDLELTKNTKSKSSKFLFV